MSDGTPIPGKPEEIDIAYPSLETTKKTPGEDPSEEASHKQTSPLEDKDPDSVPLEEAVAQLCGPQENKRPPAPLEPEVVIIWMAAPAEALPKDRDIEANKAGRDIGQTDGGDSDCQIVDKNPPGAPKPKSLRPTPQGLWRLKKAKDTSVILQLVPQKEGESLDMPPTPGPSPPGTMKKWQTQDLSKIMVEPTLTKENENTCTSTQKEKQEKQENRTEKTCKSHKTLCT